MSHGPVDDRVVTPREATTPEKPSIPSVTGTIPSAFVAWLANSRDPSELLDQTYQLFSIVVKIRYSISSLDEIISDERRMNESGSSETRPQEGTELPEPIWPQHEDPGPRPAAVKTREETAALGS